MTPVISDSQFMKGELLFHILEHDGFYFNQRSKKNTQKEVRFGLNALLWRKRRSGSWSVGICVCACESARDCTVFCARLNTEITQEHTERRSG